MNADLEKEYAAYIEADADGLSFEEWQYQRRLDGLPKPGTRVRLTCDVDRYPHFSAPRNARGTVTEATEEVFSVRMDENLPGAEDWQNEVHWYPRNCDQWPDDEIEVLTFPSNPPGNQPGGICRPPARYEDVTVDPAVVEAILNIQQAIRELAPFEGPSFETPAISSAMADLEQAVRWLKGEEEPS